MKNIRISSILLCLALVSCHTPEQTSMEHIKAQMLSISTSLSKNTINMGILAKLIGKDTLVEMKKIGSEVKQESFPEETEIIYSFSKDSSGRLISFGETPFRKNDNWKTASTHYFDTDGKTLAFINQNIFTNSVCEEKVVNEIIMEYYDKAFVQIGREYALINSNGDRLSEKKCKLPYKAYKVYRNSDSLLKKISLPVKQ